MVHRIPLTKARINLGEIVRRVHVEKECFILEKDRIPVAGIIDIDELEDYLELRDGEVQRQIKEGHVEYSRGKTKKFDTFLAELKQN